MGQPKGQKEAIAASKESTAIAKEELAMRRELLAEIRPLATSLISLGIDPTQFIQSALGQSILSEGRQAVSGEFGQARQNLVEQLGSTGMTRAGVGVGPYAGLLGQEALAQANLVNQLPQLGLNLALQGANVLQGQQAMLQPQQFLQTGIQGFNTLQQRNLLGPILGAAGSALGGGSLGTLVKGGGA